MELREATKDDLPALVDDLWIPFAEEMATIDPFDELADDVRAEALEYRTRLVERDDVGMWVALVDERYAGLATVEYQPSAPVFDRGDAARLHELYVIPEAREKGLGTRLLSLVEDWARDRDCAHLSLQVNVNNTSAREYYRDVGFEVKRETMVAPVGSG